MKICATAGVWFTALYNAAQDGYECVVLCDKEKIQIFTRILFNKGGSSIEIIYQKVNPIFIIRHASTEL